MSKRRRTQMVLFSGAAAFLTAAFISQAPPLPKRSSNPAPTQYIAALADPSAQPAAREAESGHLAARPGAARGAARFL